MNSEIQSRADFSQVRYGQCWEDADILVKALLPNDRHCLSIGSAGDNSFALLAAGAAHVTAVEMNPAQIKCIKLRRHAYLNLDYKDFLKTVTASTGKFERYFELFRTRILPLAHPPRRITELLDSKSLTERQNFYNTTWNNLRWQLIFKTFFSRFVMGRLGRDPAFFDYVEGSVAVRILDRTRYALTTLDPAQNPYLHWILTGRYGKVLPLALQRDSYEKIRTALQEGRFIIIEAPLEEALGSEKFDAFNLSDIFEYMSEEATATLLDRLADSSNPGARLAYWNMLAPRQSNSPRIKHLPTESAKLFKQDRAFFYSRFIVDEVGKF
ncbi:MAG: S-adenosylmethionine-diacylglycerol 3-amino-3-carboxypropyl transferase [Akkermansiaceae bacterium]|jgi:S-adenosylmethionine-diacylglycerol 3-amino-3-carboxypropyl transferase